MGLLISLGVEPLMANFFRGRVRTKETSQGPGAWHLRVGFETGSSWRFHTFLKPCLTFFSVLGSYTAEGKMVTPSLHRGKNSLEPSSLSCWVVIC